MQKKTARFVLSHTQTATPGVLVLTHGDLTAWCTHLTPWYTVLPKAELAVMRGLPIL